MPTSRATKRSAPRLSELAKFVHLPSGVTSTGWPAVAAKCADLGVSFRPWQPDVGRVILAKRADGKYASTIGGTGLSIPRQVGKTFLVGAIVFALCLLNPNLTVIWTAHRLRTAEETFKKLQGFANRKRVKPFVAKLVLGSGEEEIVFRNGSRILFGARERGFGRGFDEVDVLIFDEAQILSDSTLDDMIPAANQSRMPAGALLLFMGTPPKPRDMSEPWLRMRKQCLEGDDDTGWVEFGAVDGYVPTPQPAPLSKTDWVQVAKANPSFPADTPRESILRMRKKLGDASFLREGMGVYDADASLELYRRSDWEAIFDAKARRPRGQWVLAVDVNPYRTAATVAAVGLGRDRRPVVFMRLFYDVAEVVPFVGRQVEKRSVAEIAVLPGQAGLLLPDLKQVVSEKKLQAVALAQVGQACGAWLQGVKDHSFRHVGQAVLDDAMGVARTRRIGSGEVELFDRVRRDDEISPVVAGSVALYRFSLRRTKPSDFR